MRFPARPVRREAEDRPRREGDERARREEPGLGPPESGIDRADRDLLRVVESNLGEAARRAGSWLACRVGCTECCIGPFPITRLDARRLRLGLEELARADPPRAQAIVRRARQAIEATAGDFPGDPKTGRLSGDEPAEDRFFERYESVPCPVLDPLTGACELYAHRPVTCRTYGPPVVFGGEKLAPCRLCFVGAPAGEVERCRVEPDPDRIENAILTRLEKADGEEWETIIAYAILRPGP
jgi:Fe-S-cluster containining protein